MVDKILNFPKIVKKYIEDDVIDLQAPEHNIAIEFICPALEEAVFSRRETGWFKSSAIRGWAGALESIIKRNDKDVKIEILCSPAIDKSTYRALLETTTDKKKLKILKAQSEKILKRTLPLLVIDPTRQSKETGATVGQILSHLILSNKLELKFIDILTIDELEILDDIEKDDLEGELNHTKRGYFEFKDKSFIAYQGSFNESLGGLWKHGESCQIMLSDRDEDIKRVNKLRDRVDTYWNADKIPVKDVRVRGVSKKMLKRLKIIDKTNPYGGTSVLGGDESSQTFRFWGHQKMAIKTFLESEKNIYSIDENLAARNPKKCKGILNMATGTGKTKTALEISRLLLKKKDISRIVAIADSSNALTGQWLDDVKKWDKENKLNLKVYSTKERERFSLSTKPSSLVMRYDPNHINWIIDNTPNVENDTLFIFDEVHGFSTDTAMNHDSSKVENLSYTLGLSATPERKNDADKTSFMEKSIGSTIFKFNLENAIEEGILVHFDYDPIPVELSPEDKNKIRNIYAAFKDKNRVPRMTEKEKNIAISKVYGVASNKIATFGKVIKKDPSIVKNSIIFFAEIEQAEECAKFLNKEGIKFSLLFNENDQDQRLEELASGNLDCIVTCLALSQGIDINSLEKVFLAASWAEKRQTIQRIGRCVRKDPNNINKVGKVYDFVLYDDIEENIMIPREKDRADWLKKLSNVRKK